MQTQFPQVQLPKAPAKAAAPAFQARIAAPQQQVQFSGNVKFSGSGNQPGLLTRFFNVIKAMLGMKVDQFEQDNAEAVLNQTQNDVTQATRNEVARLSRVVGRPDVVKSELEGMIAAHKKEQQEADDAADLLLEKMAELQCDETDKRLDAYKKAMLKEETEAQKALTDLNNKEAEYKGALDDAAEAKVQIDQLNDEMEAAIAKLEEGKQNAAALKGLEERKQMKEILESTKGNLAAQSGSAAKIMREIALTKAGLEAELRGGATSEEVQASRQVQQELKAKEQNTRVSKLLAKRKAVQSGTTATEQQAAGGDSDIKPGS